jgi:hypothetical protein
METQQKYIYIYLLISTYFLYILRVNIYIFIGLYVCDLAKR